MRHRFPRQATAGAIAAGLALSFLSSGIAVAATDPEVAPETPAEAPSAPVDQAPAADAPAAAAITPFAVAVDPQAPTLLLKPDLNPVALSSKPGASKTIWLAFPGGELTGTGWNAGRHLQDPAKTPVPYETPIDFDAVGLDSVALRTEVFQRVSEYFSPFDVNVTTVRPSDAALTKDSPDDQQYGGVVLFTNEMFSSGLQFDDADDADGIAHGGTFGDPTDYYAWVSTADMGGNPKFLADVTAHEVGHTLGLDHQGFGTEDYYYPQGLWAPIMGKGRFAGTARWSDAKYPNAKGGQDDLAVMTDAAAAGVNTRQFLRADGSLLGDGVSVCGDSATGDAWLAVDGLCDEIAEDERQYVDSHLYYTGRLTYAADDHGDTAATATPLALGGTASGIVSTNTDRDAFSVTLPKAGVLDLKATAAEIGATLDILMTVRDSAGAVVGTYDPALGLVDDARYGETLYRSLSGTGANGTLKLGAGVYTVTIEGTGFGDLSQVTLNDSSMAAARYGSLGRYQLTATFVADPDVPVTPEQPGTNPQPGAQGGSTAPRGQLAATGSDAPVGLIGLGLLLAVLGAAAAATGARARRA
ncbi:MAG: hypothetical protein J7484_00980 [Microbacterium sp.]|nr:hypothetical protein [Microbacterium sp.]